MAISRRDILRLGVSYGTGCITFGNNSVAYDRELRKLPEYEQLEEFLAAFREAQDRLAEEAEAAQDEAKAAQDEMEAAQDEAEVAQDEAEAQPPVNPLQDAIDKATAFGVLCGRLALSELFLQTRSIIATMETETLPSVEEIEKLERDYAAIVDYVSKH
ncbi:MAG: hypothetical protein IJH83_01465 [Coriobacteriales bacterium]|nr:hypothetical protein [Coriobacteriales bacterium]